MTTKRKKAKRGHKSEFRDVQHPVQYCVEPGCKFKGERVVQGVCFHPLNVATEQHLLRIERRADEFVGELKIAGKGLPLKKQLAHAYDYLAVTWANHEHMLDDVVRLRRDLALLKTSVACKRKG